MRAGALTRGRALAEALMQTTVRVETIAVTTDQNTGADIKTATVIYTGKARVKGGSGASLAVPATVVSDQVHFPATAPAIPAGAQITVTASANQPSLVGNVYLVKRAHLAELQTAQRVEVESWE